jgi:hypothetical protein
MSQQRWECFFRPRTTGQWRKTALQSLLRRHENPWQLEVWGPRRVNRKSLKIDSVNRHRSVGAGTEIIPYVPTGVVKGRWDRDVVESLFFNEAVEIDFSERGFVDEVPRFSGTPTVAEAPMGSNPLAVARVCSDIQASSLTPITTIAGRPQEKDAHAHSAGLHGGAEGSVGVRTTDSLSPCTAPADPIYPLTPPQT